MSEIVLSYRGREIRPAVVGFLRQLIAENPTLSRRALSAKVCEAWNWVQPNGQLRDMVCRSLMLRLHREGHLELPAPRRQTINNAIRHRQVREVTPVDQTPIEGSLAALGPLDIRLVRRSEGEDLFARLLKEHHYLGYSRPVGEHLKYLVLAANRPVACLAWNSGPLKLNLRDQFVGVPRNAYAHNLHLIAYNIYGRQKARFRVRTTDSNHDQPIAPNRLAEAPNPTGPNQIWVSDITYIQTNEGWIYLAALLDLYSRKIVGWAMSEHIDSPLVLKALSMALTHRNPPSNLICHSDRGVQYASADYRHALAKGGLIPSMSRRANCYDNATMESFWSTLKLELVYRSSFPTRSCAQSKLFNYIESSYNRSRAHSALRFLSPSQFESLTN